MAVPRKTSGRAGPCGSIRPRDPEWRQVILDIFKEAAAEETPRPEEWSANISSRCGADPDGVIKTVDMLLAAERPVILVGQGVRYGGAAADLVALADRLQIPVAASASGLGAIPSEHPLALGLVSRGGLYHANHAARQADVLLALGVRFDDRTSSSWLPGYSFTIPPTKLIHVDIDPNEIARNYPVVLGLMADVRTFLRQLLAELDRRQRTNERAAARSAWLKAIEGKAPALLQKGQELGFHFVSGQRPQPNQQGRIATTLEWARQLSADDLKVLTGQAALASCAILAKSSAVTPWAVPSADYYDALTPFKIADLNTQRYTDAFNEVKAYGSRTSAVPPCSS